MRREYSKINKVKYKQGTFLHKRKSLYFSLLVEAGDKMEFLYILWHCNVMLPL